jgi:hypothetical protein
MNGTFRVHGFGHSEKAAPGGRSLPAAELLGTLLACQPIAFDIHG